MIEAEPGRWPPGPSEPGIVCGGDAGPVYDVVGSVESYLSVCSGSVCGCESVCDLPVGSLWCGCESVGDDVCESVVAVKQCEPILASVCDLCVRLSG